MEGPLFTLCAAAAAGVILVGLSARLRVPSIVLLLAGGVALGPEGAGMIDPLALGSGLKLVVGMAVAVILFEGGLTLDIEGARKSPIVIGRMLTVGVVVTWAGATAVIYWLFRPSLSVAVLCGSLVIVTGPTVVAPILRRISVRDRIKHILYWESVLVDAIGVFLAVLCFEWITPASDHGTWSPVLRFAIRVGVGAGIGAAVGIAMAMVLRAHLIGEEHVNIFVLAMALFTFAGCESILHESGVLAVIVAGLCLGASRPSQMKTLKRFKLELTELGVGTLFVLLAGTLRLEQFVAFGWELVAAVALLMFVIRPVAIFASAWGRDYSLQEKLFLGWVAPRGIVAAFLASLFALELGASESLRWEAQLLHTFTFAVIGATVILQGLSAPVVARLLRLQKKPRQTWLIVGEDTTAEPLVAALRASGVKALGLSPPHGEEKEVDSEYLVHADPLDRALFVDPRFADISVVVAISPNVYFNELVCDRWQEVVGEPSCYHWSDGVHETSADAPFIGTPIWTDAGKPTEVVAKIEAGAMTFGTMEVSESENATSTKFVTPLFRVRGDATTVVQSVDSADWEPGDVMVTLRKRVAGLEGLVRDAVVIDEVQPDFDDVVRELLDDVKEKEPELPAEELRELIVEREQAMPTAMGMGVAIPHAYHEAVENSHCYVANVPSGMAGETPDGQPIRLVFLVLSPKGAATAHLKSLAAIASLCSDTEYLELLEEQTDAAKLLQRIRERE